MLKISKTISVQIDGADIEHLKALMDFARIAMQNAREEGKTFTGMTGHYLCHGTWVERGGPLEQMASAISEA